ncbi:hypothetical protein AKO1_006986 [Acrasis kona]|uniref:Aquaporin n=1 Tax=Acrasis kona TaxID=1008807 RepID=A0AAW2YVP1_9EUKA
MNDKTTKHGTLIMEILRHIFQGPKEDPDMDKDIEKIFSEVRRGAAEFVGMFLISFVLSFSGVMHHISEEKSSKVMMCAILDGLIHAVLVYTISTVSGGHFNPSVSLMFSIKGVFKFWRVLYYWFAQFTGALSGCLLVYVVFGNPDHLGAPYPIKSTIGQALFIEIIGSFIDTLIILSVAEASYIVGTHAAIASCFEHIIISMLFAGVSKGKYNIALALAPIIVSRTHFDTIWLYLVGPICGPLIALMVCRLFITKRATYDSKTKANGKGRINPEEQDD